MIDTVLAELDLAVLTVDGAQAVAAGKLRAATRRAGLSLGDHACLAASASVGAIAVTTDRAWAELGLAIPVDVAR